MSNLKVGVKVYDNDWFLEYGLGYRDAAQLLKAWGVTFVLAQSKFLPMPDSAVKSEVTSDVAALYASYDDRKFRDALAEEGIEYWATVCTFFDPQAVDRDPSLRPIGSNGQPMEQVDWYVGIAPSNDDYVSKKVTMIERAVKALDPDGVFLSFTRWPGFWELWMSHHTRENFPEYSYDSHTLERFSRESGVMVPTYDPVEAALWIEAHARQAWTDWKCGVVEGVVDQIKDACRNIKPDIRIMLNTLPFGGEFDAAQEKVFGQRIDTLAHVVDVFEVMTYHQILKRPTSWLPDIGTQVKERSGRETVCTLQARPLYLDGIHAREERSRFLTTEEFNETVSNVENSNVDGLVVFVWSDLLEAALKHNDFLRVEAIRSAVERRQAR